MTTTLPHPSGARTLGDALHQFTTDFAQLVAQGLRSSATLAMHQEHAAWWRERASGLPLVGVTADVVSSLARAEASGRRRTREGAAIRISNGTLRKRLSTLKGALEGAQRDGLIAQVPRFPTVEFRRRPCREHMRTFGELERLALSLPLERAEWLYVAAFTGLHPSDVNRMQAYVDVDPFAPSPWFMARNTKNRDPDGQKTELAAPAADVLRRRWQRLQVREGELALEPWDKDSRSQMLRRRAHLFGLPRLRATTMRHTFITWAVDELGTITRALQETVGHRSLEQMETTYAHALRPRFGEVAAAVARKAVEAPRLPPQRASGAGARGTTTKRGNVG